MSGSLAAGQLVDERYALVEPIGTDSLGSVWRAFDRGLGRPVRLRDVNVEAEVRQEALRAARLAIRLDHPHAVHVWDAFLDGDRLVLVSELATGRSLATLLERKGTLPVRRVAGIGLDLLEPLAAAHALGVVHGPLDPRDVLVPDREPARLAGFGILPSLLVADAHPAFVPPEGPDGPASDMWVLGARLYDAVEGEYPFDSREAVAEDDVRPPARAGRLAPLLEQLLSKDPSERPSPEALRAPLAEIAGVNLDEDPLDRRRGRGRRDRRPLAEFEGTEAEEDADGLERDWNAAVTETWDDWSSDAATSETADEWLPPVGVVSTSDEADADIPSLSLAPTPPPHIDGSAPTPPPDVDGSAPAPADTTAATPPAPAASGEPAPVTGEVLDPAPPRRYRSSPSWPPPPQRRWGITILTALVMVVMLALLVTDGRLGRPRSAELLKAEDRPALSVDPASVPADWVPYRHPAVNITVSHPPAWSATDEGRVATLRDPATATTLLVDYRKPKGEDYVETWSDQEKKFRDSHPDDYRHLQLSPANFVGHAAALWEYTYLEGNTLVHAVDLGFHTKQYGFALHFRAPAASWDRMLPVFNALLASVKVPK